MSRPLPVLLAGAAGAVALLTVAGLHVQSVAIQPPPAPQPSVNTIVVGARLEDCDRELARRYGDAFVPSTLPSPRPRVREALVLPHAAGARFLPSMSSFALLVGPEGRVESVYHLGVPATTEGTRPWEDGAEAQLRKWQFEPARVTPTSAPVPLCVVVHPEIRWTD